MLESYRYYVVSDVAGELYKIRVKPMKESDKMIAELEFKRLETETAK